MFSIYTSAFNLESSGLDWKEAIDNFTEFADEVCIAVQDEKSYELVKDYTKKFKGVKSGLTSLNNGISLDDPLFDGKLKNCALALCNEEFSISLDLDERILKEDRWKWEEYAHLIKHSECKAILIPSINLCGSKQTYKDINFKWYLHKTIGCHRGVVNFAKQENGTIDIEKSDTCELIDDNGNLVPFYHTYTDLEIIKNYNIPFIYHLWAVDLDQRVRQNEIWKPVWENRAGRKVNNIILSREELGQIEVYNHNLPLW